MPPGRQRTLAEAWGRPAKKRERAEEEASNKPMGVSSLSEESGDGEVGAPSGGGCETKNTTTTTTTTRKKGAVRFVERKSKWSVSEAFARKDAREAWRAGVGPERCRAWACRVAGARLKSGRRFAVRTGVQVRCVALDAMGALLALGLEDGVTVLDFDEVSMTRGEKAKPVARFKNLGPVAGMAWSPLDENELAVSSAHTSAVYVLDLCSTYEPPAPKLTLRPKGAGLDSAGGYSRACLAYGRGGGRVRPAIFAGSLSGVVRAWGGGGAKYYELPVRSARGLISVPPVAGVAVDEAGVLICAAPDRITAFDTRVETVRAFGSTALPTRLYSIRAADVLRGERHTSSSSCTPPLDFHFDDLKIAPQRGVLIALRASPADHFGSSPVNAVALLEPTRGTLLALFSADTPGCAGPLLFAPFCGRSLGAGGSVAVVVVCASSYGRPPSTRSVDLDSLPSPTESSDDNSTESALLSKTALAVCRLLPGASVPRLLRGGGGGVSPGNDGLRVRRSVHIGIPLLATEDFLIPLESNHDRFTPSLLPPAALDAHPDTGHLIAAYPDGRLLIFEPSADPAAANLPSSSAHHRASTTTIQSNQS